MINKNIIQPFIHDGKSVKAWKEPGIYTLDFCPVSIRIPESEIKLVVEDLEKITKKIKSKL